MILTTGGGGQNGIELPPTPRGPKAFHQKIYINTNCKHDPFLLLLTSPTLSPPLTDPNPFVYLPAR